MALTVTSNRPFFGDPGGITACTRDHCDVGVSERLAGRLARQGVVIAQVLGLTHVPSTPPCAIHRGLEPLVEWLSPCAVQAHDQPVPRHERRVECRWLTRSPPCRGGEERGRVTDDRIHALGFGGLGRARSGEHADESRTTVRAEVATTTPAATRVRRGNIAHCFGPFRADARVKRAAAARYAPVFKGSANCYEIQVRVEEGGRER